MRMPRKSWGKGDIMKRIGMPAIFIIIIWCLTLAWVVSVRAATIDYNFAGNTVVPVAVYELSGAGGGAGWMPAMAFDVPAGVPVRLTSVEAPILAIYVNRYPDNVETHVTMGIWADANGQPGQLLGAFTSGQLPVCTFEVNCTGGVPLPVQTMISLDEPVLASGSYWLSATGSARAIWGVTSEAGQTAFTLTDSTNPPPIWQVFSSERHGAFRISGESCPDCQLTFQACPTCLPTVPLPTSIVLLLAGAMGVGALYMAHRELKP